MSRFVSLLLSFVTCLPSLLFAQSDRQGSERYFVSSFDSGVQERIDTLYNHRTEKAQATYAAEYFYNLNNNFPLNSHGTCSFVAISMLLSFWDTYMNDDFVPEQYEISSFYSSESGLDLPLDAQPFGSESPGVVAANHAEVANLSLQDYSQHLSQHIDDDFQAYLFNLATTMFGSARFDPADHTACGLNLNEETSLISYYLMYKRGLNSSVAVTLTCENEEYCNFEEFVVSHLLDGVPVLLNTPTDYGAHCVVAYDYERSNGRVYVHTGWKNEDGKALTHLGLEQLGSSLSAAKSAIAIEGRDAGMAGPGRHYLLNDGDAHGPESFAFPRNLRMISGNYVDVRPYFGWDSLYMEKWFEWYDPYIELEILNHNRARVFLREITEWNAYLLPQTVWDNLLYGDPFEDYFVRVRLCSDYYSFDNNLCERHFEKPPLSYDGDTFAITATDYDGFGGNYASDDGRRLNFSTHRAASGLLFKTRSFRTGRFNGDHVELSPRRLGYQEAFVEYQFVVPVDRVDLELSLRGTRKNEGLYADTAFVTIDAYRYDEYEAAIDLMSEDSLIPENWNNRVVYHLCFQRPATRIRVYAKTKGVNVNVSDSGRVCIGNMTVYENVDYRGHETIQDMPTSGDELPYEGDIWNSQRPFKTNCYCYALNFHDAPVSYNPGQAAYDAGCDNNYLSVFASLEYYEERTIKRMVFDDANYLSVKDRKEIGFSCAEVGEYDVCAAGSYKICFALDLGLLVDYHWYRQDQGGFWSHKPSGGDVRDFDFDGNPICNPRYCNKRSNDRIDSEKSGYSIHDYGKNVWFLGISPVSPQLSQGGMS